MRSRILDDQQVSPRPRLELVPAQDPEPLGVPGERTTMLRVAVRVLLVLVAFIVVVAASVLVGVAVAPITGAAP